MRSSDLSGRYIVKEADGMTKITRLLAICLVLAFGLMLVTPPISVAAGPKDYNVSSNPTDGGDGHPWDDGTTEQAPPDDGTDPQQVQSDDPGTLPVFTYEKGLLSWTQRILVTFWSKTREIAHSQKPARMAELERKTRQPRRVP